MDALIRFWNERAPREKTILAAGGILSLIAVVYMTLVEPAWTGIARLERGLPNLREQAAQLDALLDEVKELKARPQVAGVGPGEARSALERSLAAAGIKATRLVPAADGDLQITFSDVPYATWAVWLSTAERELGARTTSVIAKATATPGNADIEMALRLARR